MKEYKIKIKIIGTKASLFLLDKNKCVIDELNWTDNRDLAEKILEKIKMLFSKNDISMKDISKVVFDCDSPYFEKNRKNKTLKLELETENSKGKCGFTSWQIGEITAKTLNYCLEHER